MKHVPTGVSRRDVLCLWGYIKVSSSNTNRKMKKALAEASAFLELLSRFELLTSSLPMTRSTI